MGDAHMSSNEAMMNHDMQTFYLNFLRNIRDDQLQVRVRVCVGVFIYVCVIVFIIIPVHLYLSFFLSHPPSLTSSVRCRSEGVIITTPHHAALDVQGCGAVVSDPCSDPTANRGSLPDVVPFTTGAHDTLVSPYPFISMGFMSLCLSQRPSLSLPLRLSAPVLMANELSPLWFL